MNTNFLITKIHNVIFVGDGEYKGKGNVFNGHLDHNELIFHITGSSTVCFNGKTVKTTPDTIRFLPKGENRGYIVDVENQGECIDVFFDTDLPISDEIFVVNLQNDKNMKALFKKLFFLWVAKNNGYYFKCMSLLYEIFAKIQTNSYISLNQYDKIKPALKYIEENFLKGKISVSHLADICGISEAYLNRLFVKRFNVSPSKYIIGLKINYACDLLQSGICNITHVSEMCGYCDVYYFSRQFKEYTGITPTTFIKNAHLQKYK